MVSFWKIENTWKNAKRRKIGIKEEIVRGLYCSRRPTHSGPVNQRSQQVYTRQTAEDKIFGVTSCKRLPRLKEREKRQDSRVTRLIPCSSPRPRRWFFFFLVFFPRRWQWIQLFPALVSPTYSMKTTLQPMLVTNLQIEITVLDRDSRFRFSQFKSIKD